MSGYQPGSGNPGDDQEEPEHPPSVRQLPMADQKNMTLRLSAAQADELEAVARAEGISVSDAVRGGDYLHAPAAGFGGVELCAEVIEKAAVLCTRLARNHPLPDGNTRVAAGTISERELADWLQSTRA